MSDVCLVVGARPNFMKTAPVYAALREQRLGLLLVHTGQHYDAEMSDVFLDELGLPRPDVFLGIGSGSHAEQTARALVGIEEVVRRERPRLVVVAGDVNSTLAGALAAAKLQVSVAHIESGLRSFDRSMPEEHNRRLTDHLSVLLFAHSASAVENLGREGIQQGVELVGNTMIDSLVLCIDRARAAAPLAEYRVDPGGFALVTLHRPSLVDHPDRLGAVADGLIMLASSLPVVFPVHPRTRERLTASGAAERLEGAGVRLTSPLPYLSFLGLQASAAVVLTDSGGVQEETSFLGVRCFTLRDTTERPVTVELGTNTVLGARPERIADIPALLEREPKPGGPIPYWDGRAGARTAEAIVSFLGQASRRAA
jgi:UDP-N-acetylglucosamine 2-epimerase (non-hydrolysing)